MDLVLDICDEYLFDSVWAKLVPLSAFTDVAPVFSPPAMINGSSSLGLAAHPSTWHSIVSSLPHPPLPPISLSTLSPSDVASMSAWPRDYVPRQLLSLIVLTLIGIHVLYFLFAGLSYYFIFNHDMKRHPRFLKNQIKLEIQTSLRAFPTMTLLTLPWFQGEVMGYSRLYNDPLEYGWAYLIFSSFL
jgi:lathosterol oxidase